MNSTDGIGRVPKSPSELPSSTPPAKTPPKSAEDYVMIENRLAAQREKPTPSPQLNSIFDQLRGRLPK
ncbi:MAG TPA: hypothetical protein VHE61_13790 [Opitutaceae bacterium]|nr:hypothetical protein [Opitutaceae bacterium]